MTLELPKRFLKNSRDINEILPVLSILKMRGIREISLLEENRLRLNIDSIPRQILVQPIRNLRQILEKAINAPINIYWNQKYVDIVPI